MFLLGSLTNRIKALLGSVRAAAMGLLAFALLVGAVGSAWGQTTVNLTVAGTTNDAGESATGGTMQVVDSFGFMADYLGARFQNVMIPAGATITSATLELHSLGGGTTSFSVSLAAQDADSPPTFSTSSFNISSRTLTSEKTAWAAPSTFYVNDAAFTSPNFAPSIQEVIDRPGWAPGNSLVVITTPVSGNKGVWRRAGNAAYAPRLHITYTTDDPLVAHFKLDETSGTTAVDSSTYGNDGSLVGSPTWVSDTPQTRGLQFGSGDRVDAGNFAVSGSALTLTAWFYVETPGNDGRIVIRSDGNSHSDQSWGLTVDEFGTLDFRVHAGGTWTRVEADGVIQPERWYHAVGVYDGTMMSLYLDGQLIETKTHPSGGAIDDDPSYTVTLGDSITGGRPFVGRLDDVRVYKQTLNAAEVAEIYGLVGHWELDEASGTVARDSTAYGGDGAYAGSAVSGANGPASGTYAAEFDGASGSKIDLPAADHDFSDGLTMAIWYHADSLTGRYTDFFSFSNGAGLVDDIWFGLDGAKLDLFLSDTADGASFRGLIEDSGGSLGQWYHAVAVIDADGNATLYRDGVAVKTGYTGLPRDTARTENGIGETTFEHTMDGRLSGARIYNRPLRAEEVADLYGLEAGLVGHWKLTETSGTTAVDSGSGGLDGTYENGVALDQGGPYSGVTAPAFDGSNDHVELPEIDANFGNGMTIAAWVQPDTMLGAGQFHEVLDLSNGSTVDQILLSYSGVAGLQLYLTDTADGSSVKTVEDNQGFAPGRWVHVVATIDSSGFATLYRNGQVTKSGFFTSLPTSVARSTVTIGKSASGEHFGGGLQDVRLYNYELTTAEINEIYGLVGKWDFDEGTGTTVAESSGVASNATFNTGTPVWVDGVRGKALRFDGTNDARTAETIEPPPAGSVAFWMQSDGPPSGRQRPWGIGGDYEVWQDPDGLVSMDVSTDGYQGGFITTDPLHTKNRWYHVVAQYDSDTEEYEVYLDGQLHKSGVSTHSIQQQSANYLSFGTRTGSSERFSGALDDFRIYNRWLNPAEIAELYGLVGWWRMEESSGSAVADSSGAGNHGTVVGTPGWSSDAKEESGSIELDGSNYVQVPGLLAAGNSVSLAGWAKLTAADTGGAELISLGDYLAIRLDDGGNGTNAFAYNGSGWEKAALGYGHENSGWRHLAAVYDDEDLELRLYVDGVLEQTQAMSGPLPFSGLGTNTHLGEHGDGQTAFSFTGFLDDVRVYNRVITPDEARGLYLGAQTSGLRIVKWVEVPNP